MKADGSLTLDLWATNDQLLEWEHSFGAQGRNRTTDTAIFNRMLYQLSYLGAGLARMGHSAKRGRYRGSSLHCPEHCQQACRSWFNANCGAEPVFERSTVAQRKYARRLVGCNQHPYEERFTKIFQAAGKIA